MTGRGPPGRAGTAAVVTAVLLGACTDDRGQAGPSTGSPTAETSVAEHAEQSDDLLARTLDPDEPGCSAAVGIEGEVVWTGAGGASDLAAGRAIDDATTFDIASVSKQFTATAVLILAHEGKLSLHDPLSRWVPDLPEWSDEVTLEQLMHHESGIAEYIGLLVDGGAALTDRTSQQDAVDAMAAADVDFEPGERFAYSSSNYVLLAEVVRAAAGQELPDFARKRIFEPLGLAMEIDPFGASPDNTGSSSARAYVRDPAGGNWDPGGSRWEQVGDGSVQTTPSELVRWADNYRTGDLGGEDLLAAQLTDAANVGEGARYGAGIVELRDGSLGHGGEWAGFLSDFWISEDRRTSIAVTCNGDAAGASDVGYLSPALQREWTG